MTGDRCFYSANGKREMGNGKLGIKKANYENT